MIAHKCDVCGVLYEHYGTPNKRPNTIKLEMLDMASIPCGGRAYELCPECMAAVCEVIENRKIGGARNE